MAEGNRREDAEEDHPTGRCSCGLLATVQELVRVRRSVLEWRKQGDREGATDIEMTTRSHLSLRDLRVSARGVVHAEVRLDFDGLEPFPALGWRDFASVVLSWWCEALARMLVEGSTREVLGFMEGPFEVELVSTGTVGHATAVLMQRTSSGTRVVGRSALDTRTFAAELLRGAQACLDVLVRESVSNSDRDNLERGVGELRGAIERALP